jgi:hypothetical protein
VLPSLLLHVGFSLALVYASLQPPCVWFGRLQVQTAGLCWVTGCWLTER